MSSESLLTAGSGNRISVLILLAAPGDKLENGEFDCSDSLMKRQSSHRGEAHCQTEPRTAQICHYALQRRIEDITVTMYILRCKLAIVL